MSEQNTNIFAGVEDAPSHLKINEDVLAKFLSKEIEDFGTLLDVKKFRGGQSNPTYLLSTNSRKYVLRRKPPGKLLPSAHAVEREYSVITALHKAGYPAPKTYLLSEDSEIVGTSFYVMEFVDGRIFWNSSLPDVHANERRPLFHALIDSLADLHNLDYANVGLSNFGKPGNYFERQIGRWSTQYKAAETTQIEEMNRLIGWLPTAIPKDDTTSIVHGDYRFDNVIMHPNRPETLAVLDWELSTLGHPMADFTNFLMVYYFPPDVRGGLAGIDLDKLEIPGVDEAIARYCNRTKCDSVADLDFCLSYNMFRLAAIVQGVYARAVQGNASSNEAAKMGSQVKPLAALAWSFAEKAMRA